MSKNSLAKKVAAPQTSGNNFVKICFHILFFVTPLLLWPFTTEVFEFNKMIFVYLMTTIISTGWLIASFKNKSLEIAKTPLDLPLLLFFLSQLASTILSINPHTSLWGYYSRFHGGLMSTYCYILLFYAFVSNFASDTKGIRNIIKTILATATITAIYAVLEHFGIDKNIWVQDVQNRVFSTLGQPNWLSAYLIAIVPLTLYFGFYSQNKSARPVYLSLSALFLTAIVFTKSQSGLGATAVILLLFFAYWSKKQKTKTHLFVFIPLLILAIFLKKDFALRTFNSLNKINPFYSNTQSILNEENKTRIGGTDSMAIRRVVWEGAIKLGLKYPFFGSGVETFGYAYYNVRPVTHNYTSETDFLYNKAHNEYLNFLATTGFLGLATYLFLIFSIVKTLTCHSGLDPESRISIPLTLGFVSILITNYFGFSVVNVALFFFLFPAIIISSNSIQTKKIILTIDPFIPSLVIILFALFCLLKVKNIWLADVYYGMGKNNLESSQKAVNLNPSEPLYQSQLGFIQSLVVTQVIFPQMSKMATAEAELKLKAEKYFNKFVEDSLINTQKASLSNPWNLNLLKNKARAELNLATIDPKYNNQSINTLLKIIELSPTDPANYYNLGILYKAIKNDKDSTAAFKKAIELYPNHEGAKAQISLLR